MTGSPTAHPEPPVPVAPASGMNLFDKGISVHLSVSHHVYALYFSLLVFKIHIIDATSWMLNTLVAKHFSSTQST
jgi:hypothetical protein